MHPFYPIESKASVMNISRLWSIVCRLVLALMLAAPLAAAAAPQQTFAELVAAATGRASRIDRLRALVARLARSAETGALGPLDLTPADSDDRAFLHGLAA